MVNTGKPSTGCHLCRKRRIKCDEGKPECRRCQKSGKTCPGYRDTAQLRLLGGSGGARSARKAGYGKYGDFDALCRDLGTNPLMSNGSNKPFGCSPSSILSSSFFQGPSNPNSSSFGQLSAALMAYSNYTQGQIRTVKENPSTTYGSFSLTSLHLLPPIDQQALYFFVDNFVLLPGKLVQRGHLECVLPFSRNERTDSPFQLALAAVSLASYGARHKERRLMSRAHATYIKCLKAMNEALVVRQESGTDSIVGTILLLTVFEQITLMELKLKGWISHVHGAVALLKYRGAQSFEMPSSKKIFNSVRELMTLHFVALTKEVDSSIDWLCHTPNDDIDQKYAALNIRLADLRVRNDRLTRRTAYNGDREREVTALLQSARTLEREYREWYLALPQTAVLFVDDETRRTLIASLAHPGRVDHYQELCLAYVYNVSRSFQILNWTVILRCVAWLTPPYVDYRISEEYRDATRACRDLIQDICSSVPYHFLWKENSKESVEGTYSTRDGKTGIKGVAATYLMWPLYVVCNSDFATDSQRRYAKATLSYIATEVGIMQAALLLQISLPNPSTFIAQDRGRFDEVLGAALRTRQAAINDKPERHVISV